MRFDKLSELVTAVLIGIAATVAVVALILAPGAAKAQEPTVKKAPIVQSDPTSGKKMFSDYCAPCHGTEGKGNGPAAAAMKTAPSNLTMLAKNNGGKYPAAHVRAVLMFGAGTAAHGSKDMPVWGDLFQSLNWSSSGKQVEAEQRINNLNNYLESLQAK